MKDQLIKENVVNFLADIPAYAFIAYVNFLQVVPQDYPGWEMFFLRHGWLVLLMFRLTIAGIDLVHRIKGTFWMMDEEGKMKRRSLLSIIKTEVSQWIK